MKKIYKRKSLRRLAAAVCGALVAGMFTLLPNAEALRGGVAMPILDAKDAAVSIATNGNVMDITSTAQDNLIKWVDFSISGGKTVDFHDKNYLNYVTGSAVSDIQGILKGTGNIYLVNPNGILIGDGATINVGNLYLSTKNLTDAQLADYTTATSALSAASIADGDVINLGTLKADSVTVEGKNITFKNVANVKNFAGDAINTNVTLTANSTGEIHIGSAEGTASGYTVNGAAEIDYKLVSTAEELQAINNNTDSEISGNFMLNEDIDMSGVGSFTPIASGKNGNQDFTGRFDGLNYTIKNLAIDSGADSVGLFATNRGTIENVHLTNANVKGTNDVGNVGGIVGYNAGTVRNVSFAGSVTGTGTDYTAVVGGIVGYNIDTVERAYNTAEVTGKASNGTGGIVGHNFKGTVSQVFNTGTVTNSSNGQAGGIVGQNTKGTLENAYNTGSITAVKFAGGVVGVNQSNGTVKNVYNTGTVKGTGGQYFGGLIGVNNGTLTNGYTKSGAATGTDAHDTVGAGSGGVAIADADLKKAATFTGFGFSGGVSSDGAWRIYEGQTMPLLTAFMKRKDNITSQTEYNGGANVGATYTATNFSGEVAQNGFNYIKNVSIVTPANVTFTVDNYTRDYDGTTSAEGATLSVASGQIFTKDSYSGGTFTLDSKNAGVRTITVSNVTIDDGNGGRNYNVTYQNGTGTITRKEVTATVADTSKVYDGTTNATANGNLTGVIAGDTLTATATGNYDDKNVGTGKTVNYTGFALSGSEAGNYNLTTTVATGTGTITRKALSLVATPQTITEGEATPTFTGSVTGFVTGEGLGANDTLSFALDNPEAAAVGSYKVTGTLSIDGAAPLTSGDYGDNYTFANAATNATAFTIAAKYVPPAPTPTPSAPSGGNGGNTGNTGGNTGSTTPTNPTTPTEPTPIAPSGNTDGTTPNSGGNTSGTGANTPAPLAAAEPVIVAAVTETETIAAAATAGVTAEMTHIADNVRPTSLTAGGLLAVSNETNSAPKDAMSVESVGHALSAFQHGNGEKSAATAPNTETKSAAGSIGNLEEAVEATDLAIGTEIAETDRESKAGQENLASDTGTAGGADESAEESDEKKKQKQQ